MKKANEIYNNYILTVVRYLLIAASVMLFAIAALMPVLQALLDITVEYYHDVKREMRKFVVFITRVTMYLYQILSRETRKIITSITRIALIVYQTIKRQIKKLAAFFRVWFPKAMKFRHEVVEDCKRSLSLSYITMK